MDGERGTERKRGGEEGREEEGERDVIVLT